MKKTRPSKHELMMDFAKAVSKRSTCRRNRVGTVITNWDLSEVKAYGYNGNFAGGPNICDGTEIGKCGCVHSETNALIKSGISERKNYVMFVTLSPCVACAKLIINAGIKEVYYAKKYRDPAGMNLLLIAKIPTRQIK